jgi:hypothetical protein
MAVVKHNNAEGGTNTTAVTTANSTGLSGNAWASVNGGGGVWTYTNSPTASGGMAYQCNQAASTAANLEMATPGNTEQWGRLYMYYTAFPVGSSTTVVRVFGDPTYTEIWRFDINPSGQIRTRDGALTQLDLSSVSISLNAWWRFEWHVLMGTGTSGKIELKVFSGDSVTPFYTYTNNACNTTGSSTGTIEHMQFGPDLSVVTIPVCYMDELWIDDVGYPGPANTGVNVKPAFVQGNNNEQPSTASSLTCAYPASITKGDLLVVAFGLDSMSITPTITDTLGNTYLQAASPVSNVNLGFSDYLFYAVAASTGANTITATLSGSTDYLRLLIHEYSCADTLDGGNAAFDTAGTTAPDSGAIVTHYPNEVIVGWAVSEGNTATTGAGTNFIQRQTALSQITEDRIITSTGTYHAVYPQDNTKWMAQGAAFYSSSAVNAGAAGWLGA